MSISYFVREALEELYKDSCTIYTVSDDARDENGVTSRSKTVICENQPCRISFSGKSQAADSGRHSVTACQTVEMFLSPDIEVPAGCLIEVVRHDGVSCEYHRSGVPAVYQSHQEVFLEPVKKEA